MAVQAILPRALDSNGDPSPGAKATFYDTGTTNAQTVYSDTALTTAHTAPLVADANGVFAQVFGAGSTALKVVLTDADDVALPDGTLDPVATVSLSASGAGDISFTPSATIPATNVQAALDILGTLWSAVTTYGKSLIAAADDSAARTVLGLGGLATLEILDEDDFATDSATRPPSQQSVGAYVVGRGAPAFILEDQKAASTEGGGYTSGSWVVRDLNTEVWDDLGIVSISSNQFTVTRRCRIYWETPASNVGDNKSMIWNVTDGELTAVGQARSHSTAYNGTSMGTGWAQLDADHTYELQFRAASSNGSDGLGGAAGFGEIEVYSRIVGWAY